MSTPLREPDAARRPDSGAAETDLLGLVEQQTLATPSPGRQPRSAQYGIVRGRLEGLHSTGDPIVRSLDNTRETARSVVPVTADDIGREVVLMFEEGDLRRPIVMGFLQQPSANGQIASSVSVKVDGEQVTIEAQREVVLKCGEASITLTRAGKVLIRGTYVLSRSAGANRIKGASVEVN